MNTNLGRVGWKGAALIGLAAAALILGGAVPARAEDEEYGATFARVRHLEGDLTLQRTRDGEVGGADLNSPVIPGDSAWTEEGRAEIELADGSTVWLDQDTRLEVRSLSDINNRLERTNLLALIQGSIRIDTPDPADDRAVFQIDTNAGSVYLQSGGSFRIDADAGVATLSAIRGVAELSGDAGSVLVRSGERSTVRRGRSPTAPRPFNTLRLDEFDRFCEERAAAYMRSGGDSVAEIEDDIPYEVRPYVRELSVYGGWHHLPTYGWVWRPAYYGSWGPYWSGYWSWYPTGWVWISYDVWGWAPYRYGRWDHVVDLGWIWIPGSRWSGAWVSFAVGPSYVGWCPLNYYNLPVFHDVRIVNVININVTRLDARGWRFAPVGRFADRKWARGGALRVDRVPRGTDVVVTGRLPRFDPGEVSLRPERGRKFIEEVRAARAPLGRAAGPAERPAPFRTLERGGRVDRDRPRGRPASAPPRVEPPRARPGVQQSGPGRPQTAPRSGASPGRVPQRPEADTPPRQRGTSPEPGDAGRQASPPRGREPQSSARPQGARPQRAEPRRAEPRRETPAPQVRESERRPGHAIERLIDQIRRERQRGRPEQRANPPRSGGREQAARPRAAQGDNKPRRETPPPQRPPRKEKEKEKD
jgi:hypothetical protein